MKPPSDNQEPITRGQALRHFGLYTLHDKLSGLLTLGLVVYAVYCVFFEHNTARATLVLLAAILVVLQLLVIIGYRIGTFVLDLSADVNLMPAAAARMAVSYYQGRSLPDTDNRAPKT